MQPKASDKDEESGRKTLPQNPNTLEDNDFFSFCRKSLTFLPFKPFLPFMMWRNGNSL